MSPSLYFLDPCFESDGFRFRQKISGDVVMTTFGADLDGNGRFRARNRPYPATASSVFVAPLVCYLLANLVLEEDLCQRARIIVSKGWLDPSRKGMPSTSGLHHECEIFRVTAGKVQPPTKFVHRFMHQTIDSSKLIS